MIALVNASAGRIPLGDKTVHCSTGSPPYWSLRAYTGDQARPWPAVEYSPMPGLPPLTVEPMTCALGHEATPEAFIGHLVYCYREVYRVLRDDGVAWLNIGDSFSSQGGPEPAQTKWQVEGASDGQANGKSRQVAHNLQQGDLCLIPHRLALALQADGWLVRNDVIWAKKSPMPESIQGSRWERHRIKVKSGRPPANQAHLPDDGQRPGGNRGNQWGDVQNQPNAQWSPCPGCATCDPNGGYVLRRGSWRHTRSHEVVLQLTKKMGYWSDGEAVREANANPHRIDYTPGKRAYSEGNNPGLDNRTKRNDGFQAYKDGKTCVGRNPRSVLSAPEQLVTLRQDISEEDRNYVLRRLAKNGLL